MEQIHKETKFKNIYYRDTPKGKIYYVLHQSRKKIIEKDICKEGDAISPQEAYTKYINKLNAMKRHPTKYQNVFFRESKTNGKKDKSYYFTHNGIETMVGKDSQGIGVTFTYQKYTETVNKLRLGEEPPIKRKRRNILTFDDAFVSYIAHAKTEKKTWDKDEELYNNHLQVFHQRELVSLTQADFNNLKNEKLKIHAERTVTYILAVARQIINYAINNDLAKNYSNPISNGKVKVKSKHSISNEKTGFFTREQAEQLLEKLKEYKGSSSHIYELTVLLLHTGARFSEVTSLTWDEIDFKQRTIFFKSTKDGNERHISMSKLVKEVLKSLPKSKSELIISTFRGTQILQMNKKWQQVVDSIIPNNIVTVKKTDDEGNMRELNDEERKLLIKQTKKRLTTHSLRHTHASWMAMSGNFNLMEIRDELGHKTTKMTERYAHLLPKERHRKTNELFDNI